MTTEQIITDRIVAELDKGEIPWERPWMGVVDGPVSHATGRPYSLLNQMMLGGKPAEYITFNQAKAEGGAPKKGSHGQMVTFWKRLVIDESGDEEDEGEKATRGRTIPYLRRYTVFDIADCDGIEAKWADRETVTHEPSAEGEEIVGGYFGQPNAPKLTRDQVSNRAYYAPDLDAVTVPRMDQFGKLEEYYSTLFHEMVHSTGHASRLDRFTGKDAHFGSDDYSREELVAEIGAAALLHRIGLESPASFKNSVAYCQGWSRKLRDDPKLFTTACARAEKAVRWILEGAPEPEDGEPKAKPEPTTAQEPAPVAACGIPEQMMLF